MLDLTEVKDRIGLIHVTHNPFIVHLGVATKISQPLGMAILHCGCFVV